ncbi:MAG: hypothetical protein KME55_33980 [Nostoc indistinguendum CM1-VF10]|nr:hypothetical protein [Nostoc indistinguendum CM1-VF10]
MPSCTAIARKFPKGDRPLIFALADGLPATLVNDDRFAASPCDGVPARRRRSL